MFKLAALLGLVAGGAGYGLYTHTDLFGCKSGDGECCLLAKKSCCNAARTRLAVVLRDSLPELRHGL